MLAGGCLFCSFFLYKGVNTGGMEMIEVFIRRCFCSMFLFEKNTSYSESFKGVDCFFKILKLL